MLPIRIKKDERAHLLVRHGLTEQSWPKRNVGQISLTRVFLCSVSPTRCIEESYQETQPVTQQMTTS